MTSLCLTSDKDCYREFNELKSEVGNLVFLRVGGEI